MTCTEFVFSHEGVRTRLMAVEKGIIRITRTRREFFLDSETPAVVLREARISELLNREDENCFVSGAVQVHIRNGVLTFTNQNGDILLCENPIRPCILQEKPVMLNRYDPEGEIRMERSIDGERAYAVPSETCQDRIAYEARQQFLFAEGEALYGLGSHEEGFGNLRGHSRVLYQHNMKAVVPVLVSTKGWGILFDMGCMMAFHDDEEGSYLWADCTDELDWYFFYGEGTYASAMTKYRSLTGSTPMLPKYTLGYIQSKERYIDAEEMLEVAKEYRRRKIPLDMLVLDWLSWPEGQWGWKCFDSNRFPNPTEFINQLHDMGVKLMISIWPSMQGEENGDRRAMLEKGYMLGNRLNYNAFDPNARALYWQQAKDGLFCHGIDAWWCDCTEPFESDWHGAIRPEPMLRASLNTEEAKRYLDPSKISLYSLFHSQGIWDGQRSTTDEKRVCNLTRSSWAGQHRNGTITWSGDVSSNWETLRRQVPEGMNFCATGEGYWTTDCGGFFPARMELWFIDGDYDKGMEDMGYRELYVRWCQYAAFLPMMRSHGSMTPREIWHLGEKGTPFYDALENTIRLRYHLVPYLYTLMARLSREGTPMLQQPALIFPEDQKLRELDDQMLLGDSLLVKPVTHPMYYLPQSQKLDVTDETESVYLPEGHEWYDLYTGKHYKGGQTITACASLAGIPAFVCSGTILPWGDIAQTTAAQAELPLELIIYPGEDGELLFYDDAGDGYAYERGEYALIPMRWEDKKRRLTIGMRKGKYMGMLQTKTLVVHTPSGNASKLVYTGQTMEILL